MLRTSIFAALALLLSAMTFAASTTDSKKLDAEVKSITKSAI